VRRFPESLRSAFAAFRTLSTPARIQDFVEELPINFERHGKTCRSVETALARNEAHCLEGAVIAAAALWYHGERPLLLDLTTTEHDVDHVVALFRTGGRWGAISKTNHAVLRYRDPVYRTVRELVMSYFHEYFLDSGEKTLRWHAGPVDLRTLPTTDWLTSRKNVWEVDELLDDAPHLPIIDARTAKRLRFADPIERRAGKIVRWKG
jgi:hypothetical protein